MLLECMLLVLGVIPVLDVLLPDADQTGLNDPNSFFCDSHVARHNSTESEAGGQGPQRWQFPQCWRPMCPVELAGPTDMFYGRGTRTAGASHLRTGTSVALISFGSHQACRQQHAQNLQLGSGVVAGRDIIQ